MAAGSQAASHPSDRELMRRLARGDREALGPLVERHYVRLYRLALGYLRSADDALDVVQEVFVKAVEHAGRWDDSGEPAAWLTRIAINHAIDRYRRARRRADRESPLLVEDDRQALLRAPGPSAERRLFSREVGARVGRALQALPERQRAVFVLRHYQELPLEEIGSALGMNLGTVKSNLHRALVRLRRRLAAVRA